MPPVSTLKPGAQRIDPEAKTTVSLTQAQRNMLLQLLASQTGGSADQFTPTAKPELKKSTPKTNLVLEGDSLTVGYGPKLFARLHDDVIFASDAISGETTTQMLAQTARVNRKYDPAAKNNIVVLWAGTNDLWQGGQPEKAFDRLQQLTTSYKQQGFRVLVLTNTMMLPKYVENRDAFNEKVKDAEGPWDAVLDLAAVPEVEEALGNDLVHYTDEGNKRIADQVHRSLAYLGWL